MKNSQWFKYLPSIHALIWLICFQCSPVVSSFISGYLPSLLLAIIYYCVPPLLLSLTRWEGYPSYSSEERKASGKVFLFLVGNSFFLVTYGSLLGLIGKVIESPKQIPALLGFTVPGQVSMKRIIGHSVVIFLLISNICLLNQVSGENIKIPFTCLVIYHL